MNDWSTDTKAMARFLGAGGTVDVEFRVGGGHAMDWDRWLNSSAEISRWRPRSEPFSISGTCTADCGGSYVRIAVPDRLAPDTEFEFTLTEVIK